MLDHYLAGMGGTEICDMLEKCGNVNKVHIIGSYLGEIKDLDGRRCNALQQPALSMNLQVNCAREAAE